MVGLRRRIAVSLVLALAAASSAAIAHGVEEVEDELDRATRSLAEVDAALEAAERDIIAAETRLQEAAAALEEVEDELQRAERAAEEAEAVREARASELRAAQREAERAEMTLLTATDQLGDRSVEVFKYGTGLPQRALVAGVMGANDWHEVAVTTSTVARIVADDRALLSAAESAREAAEAARRSASDAKVAATVAEERALAEGEQLRAVVDAHTVAVAAVEAEHQRRQDVLEELQGDGELAALLVATLEDQLAQALAQQLAAEQAEAQAAEEAAEEAAAERAAQEAAAPDPEPDPEPEPSQPEPNEPEPSQPEPNEPEPDEPEPSQPEPSQPEPGGAPVWAAKLPAAGQPWAAQIDAAARANGVDGRLFAALVWTESHFRPDAQSWVGAIGLAQLMPGTAAWLGVDPWDPIQNLDGGARYLAMQHSTFGSLELALAAYNAGPNAVWAAGPGIPNYIETQLYVVRVLERYNHLAQ